VTKGRADGAAGDGLHHRRLDLQEVPRVQELADVDDAACAVRKVSRAASFTIRSR
jgi:hypothetical protein